MPARRRTHPRVAATGVTVNLRTEDGRARSSERLGNISLGGVFVEMQEPLAFGTDVRLEFNLPSSGKILRCRGCVVWSSRNRATDQDGIGVRLIDIGISDMRILAEHIATEMGTLS